MAATPNRRIRRRRTVSTSSDDVLKAKEHAKLLVKLDAKAKAAAQAFQDQQATTLAAMQKAKQNLIETAKGVDVIVDTPPGRASTTIDPLKFLNRIHIDSFLEAVTVSNTIAKEFLSERELKKISTTKPATPGLPRVVVKYDKKRILKNK